MNFLMWFAVLIRRFFFEYFNFFNRRWSLSQSSLALFRTAQSCKIRVHIHFLFSLVGFWSICQFFSKSLCLFSRIYLFKRFFADIFLFHDSSLFVSLFHRNSSFIVLHLYWAFSINLLVRRQYRVGICLDFSNRVEIGIHCKKLRILKEILRVCIKNHRNVKWMIDWKH